MSLNARSLRRLALLAVLAALTLERPLPADPSVAPDDPFQPHPIPGWVCGNVAVTQQCNNESKTSSCASAGASCSYCDAPNGTAFVTRCVAGVETDSCTPITTGPFTVDCGMKMIGVCAPVAGSLTCTNAAASHPCRDISPVGC